MTYKGENFYEFTNSSSFPKVSGIVSAARFETCTQNKLTIKVVKIIDSTVKNGFLQNAWWLICTPQLPNRYVNLYNGEASIKRLLQNYGFSDVSGCVHYKKGRLYTVEKLSKIQQFRVNVPSDCTKVLGIPQRLENSGICWYAATCFAFFYCENVRKLITSKIKDKKLVHYIKNCLYSPEVSEKLREKLWYEYAFGDEIGQAPELDGQNGLSQFCILSSKFDIPMIRYFVNNGNIEMLKSPVYDQKKKSCPVRDTLNYDGEPHLLVVRFYRGNHHSDFKPSRTFVLNGINYKLASMLLGSMHCGHQIGASSHKLSWKRWAISDSDASMFGIGPIHFCSNSPESRVKSKWWSYWRHMIPLTIFGHQKSFCDLSPHNRPTGELENKPKVSDVGDLNLDLIYMST